MSWSSGLYGCQDPNSQSSPDAKLLELLKGFALAERRVRCGRSRLGTSDVDVAALEPVLGPLGASPYVHDILQTQGPGSAHRLDQLYLEYLVDSMDNLAHKMLHTFEKMDPINPTFE